MKLTPINLESQITAVVVEHDDVKLNKLLRNAYDQTVDYFKRNKVKMNIHILKEDEIKNIENDYVIYITYKDIDVATKNKMIYKIDVNESDVFDAHILSLMILIDLMRTLEKTRCSLYELDIEKKDNQLCFYDPKNKTTTKFDDIVMHLLQQGNAISTLTQCLYSQLTDITDNIVELYEILNSMFGIEMEDDRLDTIETKRNTQGNTKKKIIN